MVDMQQPAGCRMDATAGWERQVLWTLAAGGPTITGATPSISLGPRGTLAVAGTDGGQTDGCASINKRARVVVSG